MLGTVKMPDGTTATLEDDGYWTHPDEAVSCKLDLDFSLHGSGLSHALPIENMMLRKAAKAFNGEAVPAADDDDDSGD